MATIRTGSKTADGGPSAARKTSGAPRNPIAVPSNVAGMLRTTCSSTSTDYVDYYKGGVDDGEYPEDADEQA